MEQRHAGAVLRVRRVQGRRAGDCQDEVEGGRDREHCPPRAPRRCIHARMLRLAQQ